MNKCKILRKKGESKIKIKSKKGQTLTEREVLAINSGNVKNLLHMEVYKKSNSFSLSYDITDYISLKDYLAIPLNKRTFAKLLRDIILSLKDMQKNYLNMELLILDFDKVMVNPISQSLYFAYVPIQPCEKKTSLRDFLQDIIKYSHFEQVEDHSYVKEYISMVNNGVNFSLFELEEYVSCLLEEPVKATVVVESVAEDENETNFYNPLEKSVAEVHFAYLLRAKTNEQITIDSDYFRIGKECGANDYCVNNNNVSRKHAVIISENNKNYVMDLNSTNRTRVDGRFILPEIKVEIFSGTKLIFGNEEFQFFIK